MNDLDKNLHRKTVRATLATRLLIVCAIVLSVLVVTVLLKVATQTNEVTRGIAEQQKTNTTRNKTIEALTKQIRSCTNPEGACAKRGQKQTGQAVGSINKVVILAAACSVGLDQEMPVAERQNVIQMCVIRRLAATPSKP